MDKYRKFVLELAQNKVDRVFLNSDEEHALTVLVNMFNIATDTIRIFAGCLCEHVGNQQEYIQALSNFVERGGRIRILLNNYKEDLICASNLYKRLAYYISEGKDIQIKRTNAHPFLTKDPDKKEIHFTVIDKTGYRIETDIKERKAECNFNSPLMAKGIADFFDNLFAKEESVSINLNDLFNDGAK